MQSRNDRSIIYDEEEENDLSEDTDDLDENEEVSYPRNWKERILWTLVKKEEENHIFFQRIV